MKHTVLAGGVGAARYLQGAITALDPKEVTAIVNVADDITLHGLRICPDLDTCTYTLARQIDPHRGWGLTNETFTAMKSLSRYGGHDWFSLGDQDLGTHLYRTQRLNEGATLTEVTAEITNAWGIKATLLPVTNDPVETKVTLRSGQEVGFQEYFVRMAHNVPISALRFSGAPHATPTPQVIKAIEDAETLVIAPSNPVASIQPILAVPGIKNAIKRRRARNVAVSPIIGGRALKGPADRMLKELGEEATVVGVARRYRDLAATLIIHNIDAEHVRDIKALEMRAIVMPTIMSEPGVSRALAQRCHQAGKNP
ncbi:MAG: 2-phospho-L-lactate transferase [Acidimicrobiia bacterium]|nr:2-phospho-L-lactate transferase [Acidimicrobiia bacterium]